MIQHSADLHKLFPRFSHLKSFLSLGFSTNTNVYIHSYHKYILYNISGRVVSDIQPLAFGSSLYIRYNTAAYIVNSTYVYVIVQIRDGGLYRDFKSRVLFEKASRRRAFLMHEGFEIPVKSGVEYLNQWRI